MTLLSYDKSCKTKTSHFNIHDHNVIIVQPDLYSIPSYYTPIHSLIPPDIIFLYTPQA